MAVGGSTKGTHAYDPLADHFQHLHDLRLVWASEIQGLALMDGHCRELGHRLRGVLFPGAGQPHRPLRVQRRTVENDPRGHYPRGVLHFLGALSQRAAQVELCGRIRFDGRRRVPHFQGVVRAGAACPFFLLAERTG